MFDSSTSANTLECAETVAIFHDCASQNETSLRPSAPSQRLLWSRFNALTIQPFNVREAMTRPHFFPSGIPRY
jgi:hypothetical protein